MDLHIKHNPSFPDRVPAYVGYRGIAEFYFAPISGDGGDGEWYIEKFVNNVMVGDQRGPFANYADCVRYIKRQRFIRQ